MNLACTCLIGEPLRVDGADGTGPGELRPAEGGAFRADSLGRIRLCQDRGGRSGASCILHRINKQL